MDDAHDGPHAREPQIEDLDVARYTVVRVADGIVVDLLRAEREKR